MIRRPKTYGKFMIAVFLLWQVVAVLHLVIAIHSLCPEHHAIAHADCQSGELQHHGDNPYSSNESCFVLPILLSCSSRLLVQDLHNHLGQRNNRNF